MCRTSSRSTLKLRKETISVRSMITLLDQLLAETLPNYLLSYFKELHRKVGNSKIDQLNELQQKVAQSEVQINLLREKLDSEQTILIDHQKKKSESDVELKMKDIEIERLKRKAVKDLEILTDNVKVLEERVQEKVEEIRILKEERAELLDGMNKLKAQNRDMKRNEDTYSKKLEMMEKQNSFIRSRNAGSVLSSIGTLGGDSISGTLGGGGDGLEEVWLIVKDVKDKMDKLKESIEEGVHEKCKDLTQSVLEKDNELVKLLQETDNKVREMNSSYRKEIQDIKKRHKAEVDDFESQIEALKTEKITYLKKIKDLELKSENTSLAHQQIKTLTDQIEGLTKDLKSKDDHSLMYRDTVMSFVKQIEEQEVVSATLESKLKESKKRQAESQDRIIRAFHTIMNKVVRKKASDKEVSECLDRLTDDEAKNVLAACEDLKLGIKRR